jgi:hypothetical protein
MSLEMPLRSRVGRVESLSTEEYSLFKLMGMLGLYGPIRAVFEALTRDLEAKTASSTMCVDFKGARGVMKP